MGASWIQVVSDLSPTHQQPVEFADIDHDAPSTAQDPSLKPLATTSRWSNRWFRKTNRQGYTFMNNQGCRSSVAYVRSTE